MGVYITYIPIYTIYNIYIIIYTCIYKFLYIHIYIYIYIHIYIIYNIYVKENIGCSEGSVINLGIKREHKKFNIQLYDGRDYFPYSIVRMPHVTSKNSLKNLIFFI